MFLYLVERTDDCDYDEYDAVVFRAESRERALELATTYYSFPPAFPGDDEGREPTYAGFRLDGSNLRVTLVGLAEPGANAGEVLSSFNAG